MSLKMKLISSILAFFLILSLLVVGVFAIKKAEFNVGGNINFKANGVQAKISDGEFSNGAGNLTGFTIGTDKVYTPVNWTRDLEFPKGETSFTLTFSVTNLHESEQLTVLPDVKNVTGNFKIEIGYGEQNSVLKPKTGESEVNADGSNKETYTFTFSALNEDLNSSGKYEIVVNLALGSQAPSSEELSEQMSFTPISEQPNCASVGCGSAPSGDLDIPAFVRISDQVYKVSQISSHAFQAYGGLTGKLTIPSSVTTIPDSAFNNTDFTGSFTIPNSVTTIGSEAFRWMDFIESITIGSGVTSIDGYAFYECDALTEIKILKNVASADDVPTLSKFTVISDQTKILVPSESMIDFYINSGKNWPTERNRYGVIS